MHYKTIKFNIKIPLKIHNFQFLIGGGGGGVVVCLFVCLFFNQSLVTSNVIVVHVDGTGTVLTT